MTENQIDSVVRLHEWSSQASGKIEKLQDALRHLLAVSECYCSRALAPKVCYRCQALAALRESGGLPDAEEPPPPKPAPLPDRRRCSLCWTAPSFAHDPACMACGGTGYRNDGLGRTTTVPFVEVDAICPGGHKK